MNQQAADQHRKDSEQNIGPKKIDPTPTKPQHEPTSPEPEKPEKSGTPVKRKGEADVEESAMEGGESDGEEVPQ